MPLRRDSYDLFNLRVEETFQAASLERIFPNVPNTETGYSVSLQGDVMHIEGYLAIQPRYDTREVYTGPNYNDSGFDDLTAFFWERYANQAYWTNQQVLLPASNPTRPRSSYFGIGYSAFVTSANYEAHAYAEHGFKWGDAELSFAQIDAPLDLSWFSANNVVHSGDPALDDQMSILESFVEYSWRALIADGTPSYPWTFKAIYGGEEYPAFEHTAMVGDVGEIRSTSLVNPTYLQLRNPDTTIYHAVPKWGAGRIPLPLEGGFRPLELRFVPTSRGIEGEDPRNDQFFTVQATWHLRVRFRRPLRTFALEPIRYTINARFDVGTGPSTRPAPPTLHAARRKRDQSG